MNKDEQLDYLISELIKEDLQLGRIDIPPDYQDKRKLLRALMNIRPPRPISNEFLAVQDEFLSTEAAEKGIVDGMSLPEASQDTKISLWQGDITTLKADAIVNAANDRMLGCFVPCHACIDNAIHSAAGIQLRLECDGLMKKQSYPEPTGKAKITKAYNLPCNYVLHTVGPIVTGQLTEKHQKQLASCYQSCLELAAEKGLLSTVFCCISTGEFHFPNKRAAEIAVATVQEFLNRNGSGIKVIFNVFKDIDYQIYRTLLGADKTTEK